MNREKRVLALDDSSSIRKMVEFSLKTRGFNVTCASDGQEGIELVAKDQFDIIILDINMPRLDGFEFLKKLKGYQAYDNVPVIMLTTEGQEEDKKTALSLGARDYLVKPFKPSELIALVNKFSG